jgi:ubiquinone/menaquinone biosynthesis C-methylase UbiE
MASHQQQHSLVREQFTRTAQVFGDYAVASRVAEAERLARMVKAGPGDRAVDLACGAGTLALRFARHVRWICGLDLTPAILERARRTAAAEGLANLEFAIGDAQSLPFPDASLDIAVTSCSVYHFPDPARTIGEMARVVRRGGRVGILDILLLPDDPAISALNTRIEKLRDASHTRTLSRREFESHFLANGLRLLETGVERNGRSFDQWMLVAGLKPGDPNYAEARRPMEAPIPSDAAWFHPRFAPGCSGQSELVFTNMTYFIAGEKL